MALSTVTREHFNVISELEVVHLPTGAVFRAYPYSNPDHILQSVKVTWGRAGAPSTGDYAEQVRHMAAHLLLERAHRVARDRRLGNAA